MRSRVFACDSSMRTPCSFISLQMVGRRATAVEAVTR